MNRETLRSNAPILETERLTLKPLSIADTDALHRISNEPLVRRYLWDDEPVSRTTIEEVIAQSIRMFSKEGLVLFGVRLRGAEDLVGFRGFLRIPDGPEEGELEAARACLRYAFEGAGRDLVVAGTDAPNVASLRVIEKLGMKPIGNVNPHAPDAPYYALYGEDFLVREEP